LTNYKDIEYHITEEVASISPPKISKKVDTTTPTKYGTGIMRKLTKQLISQTKEIKEKKKEIKRMKFLIFLTLKYQKMKKGIVMC
jgi:hypothetical protein